MFSKYTSYSAVGSSENLVGQNKSRDLERKYFTSDTFKVKVNMIVILYKILKQPKPKKGHGK